MYGEESDLKPSSLRRLERKITCWDAYDTCYHVSYSTMEQTRNGCSDVPMRAPPATPPATLAETPASPARTPTPFPPTAPPPVPRTPATAPAPASLTSTQRASSPVPKSAMPPRPTASRRSCPLSTASPAALNAPR